MSNSCYNARMNILEAIRHMISKSGNSARAVSIALGKVPTYISSLLYQNTDIGINNVAKIAKQTGYEVILRGRGEEIVIDPPEDTSKK